MGLPETSSAGRMGASVGEWEVNSDPLESDDSKFATAATSPEDSVCLVGAGIFADPSGKRKYSNPPAEGEGSLEGRECDQTGGSSGLCDDHAAAVSDGDAEREHNEREPSAELLLVEKYRAETEDCMRLLNKRQKQIELCAAPRLSSDGHTNRPSDEELTKRLQAELDQVERDRKSTSYPHRSPNTLFRTSNEAGDVDTSATNSPALSVPEYTVHHLETSANNSTTSILQGVDHFTLENKFSAGDPNSNDQVLERMAKLEESHENLYRPNSKEFDAIIITSDDENDIISPKIEDCTLVYESSHLEQGIPVYDLTANESSISNYGTLEPHHEIITLSNKQEENDNLYKQTLEIFESDKPGPRRLPSTIQPVIFSTASPIVINTSVPDSALYENYYHSRRVNSEKVMAELKDLLESHEADDLDGDQQQKVVDTDLTLPGFNQKFKLMSHQKIGLAWLQKMEESNKKGGILADEMGLGKTIQTLGLIISRPSKDPSNKTTLIIAPVSLLHQWASEIRAQSYPRLSVFVQHGVRKVRCHQQFRHYDVVLTTYGQLAHEFRRYESDKNDMTTLFINKEFYRMVLDEAQYIKNVNTLSAKACCMVKASYRWCLSGTPMQNKVDEMYSYLKFLRIRPYNDWTRFRSDFTIPLDSNYQSKNAMRKFQVLLKGILLRRTKQTKIGGVAICDNIPPKTASIIHAAFSEDEEAFYKALEKGAQMQINRYVQAGTMGKNYSNLLVLLLRLRQACCHPHLIPEPSKEKVTQADFELQRAYARAFSEQTVQRIKNTNSFECSICFEVCIPKFIVPCGHYNCTECIVGIINHGETLALESGLDHAECPQCRGPMAMDKLVSLQAFCDVHGWDGLLPGENILDGIKANVDIESEIADEKDYLQHRLKIKEGKAADKSHGEDKSIPQQKKRPWLSSAKIDKLCEILERARSEDLSKQGEPGFSPTKTIVFSQFTGFLDLIRTALSLRGINFGQYDGRMSTRSREEALGEFRSRKNDVTVLLISLKAGNVGLNLTEATQVIILDPFWNPFVEEQAIDRAHRIGQSKPVTVYRIIIPNTVEDRIVELQKKKQELISASLSESGRKAMSRLSVGELVNLFLTQDA